MGVGGDFLHCSVALKQDRWERKSGQHADFV